MVFNFSLGMDASRKSILFLLYPKTRAGASMRSRKTFVAAKTTFSIAVF